VEKTQPSARGGLIGELVVRFRPETPGEKEIIPVGTPIEAQSFQLSADGLRATALVPAPLAARLNLKEHTSESLMDGTWPIMAPDNSYLTAVLDTPKGTLQFYTPNQREPVALNLSSLGGMAGGFAWQPRWANRGGFLAFSGPYEKPPDDPSFDPASMGSKSEIFLGRLGAGATEFQGVVQITQNDRSDFFPDVYIFGPPVPLAGFEQAPPDRSMDQPIPWPQTTEALHFAWNELGVDTKLPASEGAQRICRVEARKFARFNRLLSMELNGGQFVADSESSSAIASACQTSHEFTFEALIMEGVEGYDPISLKLAGITGADGAEYFGLYRLDHRLVARLLLGKEGESALNYPYKLLDFRIEFGRPYHLVVTLKGKSLRCYVDGQLASEVFVEREGLAGWKSGGSLAFGDAQPFDGGRWLGSMEQVACYSRELTDREGARHFEAAKQKISKLKPVDRVTVVGKLLEITPLSADPASPYPRMLLASRYEIESVARGVFQPKEITLLHWGMLDRKEVPNRPVKLGQRYSLAVEPISLHPELKSERIENTTSDTTSPLYYEISTPGKNLEAE
jgi:hypothetical protein